MKQIFLILFLLLSLSCVSALEVGAPINGVTYRSSIIDLSYSTNLTGLPTCFYNIDGMVNITLTDCLNESIEVPINTGEFDLTIYENNLVTTQSKTIEVSIDNDFSTAKAVTVLGSMLGLMLLSFLFWYPCFKFDELHTAFKLFLTLLGFFSIQLFLYLGWMIAQNFIHIAPITNLFSTLYNIYIWVFYFIVTYFLIMFIKSTIEEIKLKNE